MNTTTPLKDFDLSEAIARTAETTGVPIRTADNIIKQFLEETENALAEHGSIHYMNHFSVRLLKRKARRGTLKGRAWKTPDRVEPEFEASAKLKKRIEEKQGIPCA